MKKLKFNKTSGPFGDCTSNYDITFDGTMTVQEFIDEILKRDGDWGSIEFDLYSGEIEYSYGEIIKINAQLEQLLNCEILSIWANGGWSMMSYRITLKQKNNEIEWT